MMPRYPGVTVHLPRYSQRQQRVFASFKARQVELVAAQDLLAKLIVGVERPSAAVLTAGGVTADGQRALHPVAADRPAAGGGCVAYAVQGQRHGFNVPLRAGERSRPAGRERRRAGARNK